MIKARTVFSITEILYIFDPHTIENTLKAFINNIRLPIALDRDALLDALLAREELMTTAISNGIAIPHVRKFGSEAIKEDIIAIAYLMKPIDWRAPDGNPVHTLFFVLAQDEAHHLQILAEIAHMASDESFVEFLKTMPDREALLKRMGEISR